MFSKDSILHDVNVIIKITSYILFLLTIVFFNNGIYFLSLGVFIYLYTREFKIVGKISFINFIIGIYTFLYPQYLWISKIILVILYTILVKKITKVKEFRYILEITLYRFKSTKITYIFLYNLYFLKYLKNNFVNVIKLKKEYGFKGNIKSYKYMISMSYRKTKQEIKELIIVNNLRFYNISDKRTYLEDNKLEVWDLCYLFIHFVVLIILIFVGR